MNLKQCPYVNNLINNIKDKIISSLEDNFIGIYLYGSATAGDFDPNLSDIDLITIIKSDLSKEEFNTLKKMHTQLVTENLDWRDRIEVIYLTLDGLKNFKNKRTEVAKISPGEPFHLKEIGDEYLINWYVARQNSIALFGPDPKNIFPEISVEEYKEAIKAQTLLWKDSLCEYTLKSTRGSLAYAILTLCRALYSKEFGVQTSKIKSAEWTIKKFPQWKELISEAIEWRKVQWQTNQKKIDNKLPQALEFLKFTVSRITK